MKLDATCRWITPLLTLVLGVILGAYGQSFILPLLLWTQDDSSVDALYQNHQYRYINPLLSCDSMNQKTDSEFRPLESELTGAINRLTDNTSISVSLYFKELNSGHQTAINENAKYAPASLLKVPVMIAFYKMAESDLKILSQKLKYDGSFDVNKQENFTPLDAIKPGVSYTVAELVERMIVYSDNNAMTLLSNAVDMKALNEVFIDMGLTVPTPADDPDFITVKNYSRFFRVLYHSTYLSRESSEKALELLSRDKFFKGIVAGVPADIAVAQKFGERAIFQNNSELQERELHDCGIVYDPGNPYLLCVMTKGGASFEKLTDIIRSISASVYQYRHP